MSQEVLLGDCGEVMAGLEAESFHAVVCDPPYGLEFMGRDWDRLGGDPFAGFNPTCASCGGRARGEKRCECAEPDWRVKGRSLGDVRQPGDANYTEGPGPFGRAKVRYGGTNAYDAANSGRAMQEWHRAWAVEAFRVLKPGGYVLAFGGTRTYHRLAAGLEDAGFEIRDSVLWLYGSG